MQRLVIELGILRRRIVHWRLGLGRVSLLNFGMTKEVVEEGMKIQALGVVDMDTVVAAEVERPKEPDYWAAPHNGSVMKMIRSLHVGKSPELGILIYTS